MVKEFGLMVFMAGVGLSAGAGINNGLGAVGGQMLAAGLIVSLGAGGDLLPVRRLRAAHEPGDAVRRHDGSPHLRPGDGDHQRYRAQQHSRARLRRHLRHRQRAAYPCRDAHRDHLAGGYNNF